MYRQDGEEGNNWREMTERQGCRIVISNPLVTSQEEGGWDRRWEMGRKRVGG